LPHQKPSDYPTLTPYSLFVNGNCFNETSCDETAVAVVRIVKFAVVLIPKFQSTGSMGVVPEVTSRQHVETINQAIARALEQAQLSFSIGIAATRAWTRRGAVSRVNCCKTLAMVHQKPFFGEFIIWKATFMLTI